MLLLLCLLKISEAWLASIPKSDLTAGGNSKSHRGLVHPSLHKNGKNMKRFPIHRRRFRHNAASSYKEGEAGEDKASNQIQLDGNRADSSSSTTTTEEAASMHEEVKPYSFRTPQQERRLPRTRKPKFYWTHLENVQQELYDFWANLGIQSLCLPNETLLNYFQRHDLRAAIATHGGREVLAYKLKRHKAKSKTKTTSTAVAAISTGIKIMPGRWNEAVTTSLELHTLLQNKTIGLSEDRPPKPPSRIRRLTSVSTSPPPKEKPRQLDTASNSSSSTTKIQQSNDDHKGHDRQKRRSTHPLRGRKPHRFWTRETVIQELYDYLVEYSDKYGRPRIWMPRLSEIKANGRQDLAMAILQFGGARKLTQQAGLIPFREWSFFEGQYELLVRLKEYIDEHPPASRLLDDVVDDDSLKYRYFPCVSQIREKGHERLHLLIQYYGGNKFLSSRLGMTKGSSSMMGGGASPASRRSYSNLSWGEFSIVFAIQLLEFIRRDHMRAKAPILYPVIAIPGPARLDRGGPEGVELHDKIVAYGGFENVARRLYLEYRTKRQQ